MASGNFFLMVAQQPPNSAEDERDEKRSVAPLKPSDDAFIIDTSTHDAEEVFNTVRQVIVRKYPALAA